ncbi:MAG: DUF1593 domain-containing protein [Planctomycetia bacterium]|nr:DUF1593 domain-containing protein [Planctomycetia bacterium]
MTTLRVLLLLNLAAVAGRAAEAVSTDARPKPRVIVLTDIENEPDDAMSLVRFLVYSNQWDTEGLVATTSVHQPDRTAAWRIREIVTAYGRVRDNLELHERGFPREADLQRESLALHSMVWAGGVAEPGRYRVQCSAHGTSLPCTVSLVDDNKVRVTLDSPHRRIAPGQSAVLYDEGDNYVVAGGLVSAASAWPVNVGAIA